MAMSQVMKIDGSIKEGGGQIIRIATVLSVLLNKPIEIINIRAGRKKPGLAAQHLKGLQLASNLCNGKLSGGELGSVSIKFVPSQIKSSNIRIDVGTAGSVVLLLQVALPVLMFASGECSLELIGGTNADFAPQIDYLLHVFQPIVSRMGMVFKCDIVKRGFFPKGGGIVRVNTSGPINGPLRPIVMVERGQLVQVTGMGFIASNIPDKALNGMKSTAERLLKDQNIGPAAVTIVREPDSKAIGNGCGLLLKAETSGHCILSGSGLGRRGVTTDQVAEEAVKNLLNQIVNDGRCVDEYLQDQLILLMALADGTSRIRTGPLTLHTETAIEIAEMMIGKKIFTIIDDAVHGNVIECLGIGFNGQ